MRFFLEIAYCGKDFVGWQSQNNGLGVQQVIEQVLEQILRRTVQITGSGRTDAGVHASGQVAHFDVEEDLPPNFVYSLNSILPPSIAIKDCYPVSENAHARFSALSRSYLYCISRTKDPFSTQTSWQFTGRLNLEAMQEAAELLYSISDFTSVSKFKQEESNHICKIHHAQWRQEENRFYFKITANRFLWRMVRLLVGAMVEIGRGDLKLTDFERILTSTTRGLLHNAAPAHGLFLTHVDYESNIKIKKRL